MSIIYRCKKWIDCTSASFNLLWSPDIVGFVSLQVQTVLSQSLPTPPSGVGRSTLKLGWPGLPIRPWLTRTSCGSSEATSSTPPTITWSKRKYSPLWASTLWFEPFGCLLTSKRAARHESSCCYETARNVFLKHSVSVVKFVIFLTCMPVLYRVLKGYLAIRAIRKIGVKCKIKKSN